MHRFWRLLAAVVLLIPAGAAPLRQRLGLDSGWRFERQVAPDPAIEWPFRDAWTPAYDDSKWSRVFLPHSWDQSAHNPWVALNHWRGVGWYRKTFSVPALFPRQRVFLEFEGASQVVKAWVNGRPAGEHVGGYTGFVFDVTDLVNAGADNLLCLSVDDTNSPDIPPANETNIAIYGGVYRDVWLHITGPVLIPDGGLSITTPVVSREQSTIQVSTEVRNSLTSRIAAKVVSEIISPAGDVVAAAQQEAEIGGSAIVRLEPARFKVAGAGLWSPGHPILYTLRSRLYRDGAPADEISTRFGVRAMGYLPGKGYTINGEFINIHGVNRRQDYAYLGDALPDAVSRRDMEIIKQLGANMVRTSHYVQDKSILEAADELGLLVWEEIPNIKIYDYTPGPMSEKGDSRYTRRYIESCLAALEEMIRRDRNHPSIVIWGIADDMTGYPYIQDLREMNDRIHQLDPTRWTAGRVNPTITDVRDPTNNGFFDFQKLSAAHPDWKWLWNEWGAFKNERGLIVEPLGNDIPENGVGIVSEYRRSTIPSELTGAIAQEAAWLLWPRSIWSPWPILWKRTWTWTASWRRCRCCRSPRKPRWSRSPPRSASGWPGIGPFASIIRKIWNCWLGVGPNWCRFHP